MQKVDILRALKDSAYRNSLSDAEKAQLPDIANLGVIADTDLENVVGGAIGDRLLWTITDTSCKSHCVCRALADFTIRSADFAVPAPCT